MCLTFLKIRMIISFLKNQNNNNNEIWALAWSEKGCGLRGKNEVPLEKLACFVLSIRLKFSQMFKIKRI